MIIRICLIFIVFGLLGCKSDLKNCRMEVSKPVLLLYKSNEDLIKEKGIELSLDKPIKQIVLDFHTLSGELMNQSGGVDEGGFFLHPCNHRANEIIRDSFYESLSGFLRKSQENQIDASVGKLLEYTFLEKDSPLSKESIDNKTTIEVCLYLLAIENRILISL